MTWAMGPLDRVSIRLTPPPFNLEGVWLPCAPLCGFGLALLAAIAAITTAVWLLHRRTT